MAKRGVKEDLPARASVAGGAGTTRARAISLHIDGAFYSFRWFEFMYSSFYFFSCFGRPASTLIAIQKEIQTLRRKRAVYLCPHSHANQRREIREYVMTRHRYYHTIAMLRQMKA